MDDLLASILENNTTDPERLALAARIADHYRQAKTDELRAKELELRNNEVQRDVLRLKLKEKEFLANNHPTTAPLIPDGE